ncbi:transaldolase family protein [Thiocapsa bogorovii]|uniref:transaldolase family protein n=1 Tax=Thiocapsa bogorovii TaxID=521689 RepID=UPI001E3AA564|nr:transaldolase family protein [Thiocapsa bogorovii]UHD16489.1 hypothetical protein LT988_00005 [Thiocapsa bogorovii]
MLIPVMMCHLSINDIARWASRPCGAVHDDDRRPLHWQQIEIVSVRQRTDKPVARRQSATCRTAGSVSSACSSSTMVIGETLKQDVASPFHNRLGIAIAMRTYQAHCELLASERWQRLAAAGARPQRLLWASTGTKDPAASDTLYVQALAAPGTINTLPEKTLLAFADHGQVERALPTDGGDAEAVIADFRREGVDDDALAARLQREGVDAFASSWHALLTRIREKGASPALRP